MLKKKNNNLLTFIEFFKTLKAKNLFFYKLFKRYRIFLYSFILTFLLFWYFCAHYTFKFFKPHHGIIDLIFLFIVCSSFFVSALTTISYRYHDFKHLRYNFLKYWPKSRKKNF